MAEETSVSVADIGALGAAKLDCEIGVRILMKTALKTTSVTSLLRWKS